MTALVAALAAVLVLPADLAAAHGDDGAIEVVAIEATEDASTTRITVDVRFDGDDHAVYRGSVQLAGRSSTGVSLLPVQFSSTDVDGRYVADAPLGEDGVWELRIMSREPQAELRVEYDPSDPERFAVGTEDANESALRPQLAVALAGCGALGLVALLSWRRNRSVRARGSNELDAER